MHRIILALGLIAMLGFAAAQITIEPVDGTGDDAMSTGTDNASVDQTIVLEIPQATGLHLTANRIEFDLENDLGTLSCVYVTGDDVTNALGSSFYGQTQAVPGGIAYEALSWDDIKLVYFGNGESGDVPDSALVQNYPPITMVNGEVDNATKSYFVCYQSFVMQLFANYDSWQLRVERTDTTDQGIEHLYVQANTCADFGAGTGLYALDNLGEVNLLPTTVIGDTTGALAASTGNQCRDNTSWLDILGVMAVKINSDEFGTNTADLTYTLATPAWFDAR